MHDFDEVRAERFKAEREFKLGGEVFVRRPTVRPEAMIEYEDLGLGATAKQNLEVIDRLILAFIQPDGDAHDRYKALREREEDAISVRDLNDVVRWLITSSTARPTSPPSPSTPGQEGTGTTSKDTASTGAETG